MALPSSGNPISFGDINDELGENTTDTLDIQSAAQQFTGILDDGTISMDEFHGLTFSAGSGTYGTRNSHAFRFINASPDRGFADGELVSAAENSTTDLGGASLTGQSDFVDDYINNDLTNGDTVFANSTGTTKTNLRPGGDFASGTHFLLDTTANKIAQIDSNGDISNVTSRTPATPTISLTSKNTNSITISIVGSTVVTRQYAPFKDGVELTNVVPSPKGNIANTSVTTAYTYTGLDSNTSYALKVRGENTFANGSDSNTLNVTTDGVGPTINSFTATRSETVAGRIDLAWNITAGDGSITSFLITRKQNSEAGASDTQVTTTNDASEAVTGLGSGNTFHFFLRAITAFGTATANANATTRPAPTIDTFTVAAGSSAGEIDITYATSNADTVTLKEDNTNDGTFETTILNNSSTVDGSVTRTGLTSTNSHNYQLTATGAGSVVATDDAFPAANTTWTNSVSQINLINNTGKRANADIMNSAIQNITVNNPSGNTSVSVSQTGIEGASLKIRWADNSGFSGASAYATSISNIPSSVGTIYYQLQWTEKSEQIGVYSPGSGMFDDGTFAGSVGPLNKTIANVLTWTNNGVSDNTIDVDLDFFNNDIDENDLP